MIKSGKILVVDCVIYYLPVVNLYNNIIVLPEENRAHGISDFQWLGWSNR
jgi:hypothetical protein